MEVVATKAQMPDPQPPWRIWAFLEWIKVQIIGAAASFAFPDTVPRARGVGAQAPAGRADAGGRGGGARVGVRKEGPPGLALVGAPLPCPRRRLGKEREGRYFFYFHEKKDRSRIRGIELWLR